MTWICSLNGPCFTMPTYVVQELSFDAIRCDIHYHKWEICCIVKCTTVMMYCLCCCSIETRNGESQVHTALPLFIRLGFVLISNLLHVLTFSQGSCLWKNTTLQSRQFAFSETPHPSSLFKKISPSRQNGTSTALIGRICKKILASPSPALIDSVHVFWS